MSAKKAKIALNIFTVINGLLICAGLYFSTYVSAFGGDLEDMSFFLVPTAVLFLLTSITRRKFKSHLENNSNSFTLPLCIIATPTVLIILLAFLAAYGHYFPPAPEDILLPEDPLVGEDMVFGVPLLYSEQCKGCTYSPKALEINRRIDCVVDSSWHGSSRAENIVYIPRTMEFNVIEVFDRINKEGKEYRDIIAVLRDSNGFLSTIPTSSIGRLKEFCTGGPTHLDKLFRYIEIAGRARIEVALYDYNAEKSDYTLQQEFVESLPEGYNFSNIHLIDSVFFPELVGVRVDVDADALAFLVSKKKLMNIWGILGLDEEYRQTLTQEDLSEMLKDEYWYD